MRSSQNFFRRPMFDRYISNGYGSAKTPFNNQQTTLINRFGTMQKRWIRSRMEKMFWCSAWEVLGGRRGSSTSTFCEVANETGK